MTRRLGTTGCATLGMIFAGITLALFPWADSESGWYLLRFLNGCAGAMSLVPLETVVSRDSLPDKKTQNFAFYGVSLTVGGALGIGVGLNLYHPGNPLPFYLGGGLPIIAGFTLLSFFTPTQPAETSAASIPLDWRNFLSYGTAWFQGFLEGGMLAFLSLFLLSCGFTESIAGTLMGMTMVGVILFQVPVSWLADRYGKTPMLSVATLSLRWAVVDSVADEPDLAGGRPVLLRRLHGGDVSVGPVAARRSDAGRRPVRAYAWYLAVECIGSQAGAAAMGYARDAWGQSAMFTVGLAACWRCWRLGHLGSMSYGLAVR